MSDMMPKPLSTRVTFEITMSMKVCRERIRQKHFRLFSTSEQQFGKLPPEKSAGVGNNGNESEALRPGSRWRGQSSSR